MCLRWRPRRRTSLRNRRRIELRRESLIVLAHLLRHLRRRKHHPIPRPRARRSQRRPAHPLRKVVLGIRWCLRMRSHESERLRGTTTTNTTTNANATTRDVLWIMCHRPLHRVTLKRQKHRILRRPQLPIHALPPHHRSCRRNTRRHRRRRMRLRMRSSKRRRPHLGLLVIQRRQRRLERALMHRIL